MTTKPWRMDTVRLMYLASTLAARQLIEAKPPSACGLEGCVTPTEPETRLMAREVLSRRDEALRFREDLAAAQRDVEYLRQEIEKMRVAERVVQLVGSPPAPTPTDPLLDDLRRRVEALEEHAHDHRVQ